MAFKQRLWYLKSWKMLSLQNLTEQGMQKPLGLTVHKTLDQVGHAYITYIHITEKYCQI